MSIVLAALAFLMEPAPPASAPTFEQDIVMLQNGAQSSVGIVGGSETKARIVCPPTVQVTAPESVSDGDTILFNPGPGADGPFVTHCTLRSAEGSDVLIVAYAGP